MTSTSAGVSSVRVIRSVIIDSSIISTVVARLSRRSVLHYSSHRSTAVLTPCVGL